MNAIVIINVFGLIQTPDISWILGYKLNCLIQ
jgi:hypothetical protein